LYIINIIELYFFLIFLLWALFGISLLYSWSKLIYYICYKEPKYWKKLYLSKRKPIIGNKILWNFYFGKQDFDDQIIRMYKLKIKLFLSGLLLTSFLNILSMIIIDAILF